MVLYYYFSCFHFVAVDPFGNDEDDIDVQSLFLCHVAVRLFNY